MEISKKDVELLLSFCPRETPDNLPKDLDPTFYHTLSYTGDLQIAERVQTIREKLKNSQD